MDNLERIRGKLKILHDMCDQCQEEYCLECKAICLMKVNLRIKEAHAEKNKKDTND